MGQYCPRCLIQRWFLGHNSNECLAKKDGDQKRHQQFKEREIHTHPPVMQIW